MTLSKREQAKRNLVSAVRDELTLLLTSVDRMQGQAINPQAVSALSLDFVEHILRNEKFLDNVVEFAPRKLDEWLTTEAAARLSGFSRPYIIALLNSGKFGGRVSKTEKGHRRIAAIDFRKWMDESSHHTRAAAHTVMTVEDVRSGPRDEEPVAFANTAKDRAQREKRREDALPLARSMGLR